MNKTNLQTGFDALENADKLENDKLNNKTKSKSTPKSTDTKKSDTKSTPVINLDSIKKQLPTDKPITPATLDKLFNLNDGGKTIRRHLRKHYAEQSSHEHKSNWAWNLNDPVLNEILTYFSQRYATVK